MCLFAKNPLSKLSPFFFPTNIKKVDFKLECFNRFLNDIVNAKSTKIEPDHSSVFIALIIELKLAPDLITLTCNMGIGWTAVNFSDKFPARMINN